MAAALPASESKTLFTCTNAAGLLDCAELAIDDKADTTAVPAEPDTLMGAAATADSTLSAVVWAVAPIVEVPSTTASTPAATVEATEPVRVLGVDETVPRTESAADCIAGVRLALGDAETAISSTSATCAKAAGLLDCAELAMEDSADITAVPADPVAPVGAAATAASTVSALDWLSGVSVTFGAALTAASTS